MTDRSPQTASQFRDSLVGKFFVSFEENDIAWEGQILSVSGCGQFYNVKIEGALSCLLFGTPYFVRRRAPIEKVKTWKIFATLAAREKFSEAFWIEHEKEIADFVKELEQN